MTNLGILNGDVTTAKASTLVTAINPRGMWFGGIDAAIQRVAGNTFHRQAEAAMPLEDGQVIYAVSECVHQCRFDSVLFVVDDLAQPLENIVTAALKGADDRGLEIVSLPTIRTGVMSGVYETRGEAVDGLARAVTTFVDTHPSSRIRDINVVVYNNPSDAARLESLMFGRTTR